MDGSKEEFKVMDGSVRNCNPVDAPALLCHTAIGIHPEVGTNLARRGGDGDRCGGGAIVVGVVGPVAVLANVPSDVKSVATAFGLKICDCQLNMMTNWDLNVPLLVQTVAVAAWVSSALHSASAAIATFS